MSKDLRPIIGISANVRIEGAHTLYTLRREYVRMTVEAGGAPIILPHEPELAGLALRCCNGVIISGGDDIDMRPFGEEVHPRAELAPPLRQHGELALLRALDHAPEVPLLGICMGMQLMGVKAGCRFIQHLDDELQGAERHRDGHLHPVSGALGSGLVASFHHQALGDPGPFEVIGRSDDGVIEAIRDPRRPFAIGVQWHPERTADETLGIGLFRNLVDAAKRHADRLSVEPLPFISEPLP
ncbi:MAG: gamma-glutamyl-gamma-aminobutyrate hydrolase family protein [Phycisphaeraceae bacterium]|nr:gamma-glutamyl-gamma-aminobutyrate hydrolase family protein [Phycisphaeraceae bacterium]